MLRGQRGTEAAVIHFGAWLSAPGPEALLSLVCPLVATGGKSGAEPGAPGRPGPVGASCQTNILSSSSAGRTAGGLWSCSIFLKMTLGSWGSSVPLTTARLVWQPGLLSPLRWVLAQDTVGPNYKKTMEALCSSSPACLRKPLYKQQGSRSSVPRFCPPFQFGSPSPLPLGS